MRTEEELVQQRAPWQRYLFGQWSVALIITRWLKAPSRNGCRLSCQPKTLEQPDTVIILGAFWTHFRTGVGFCHPAVTHHTISSQISCHAVDDLSVKALMLHSSSCQRGDGLDWWLLCESQSCLFKFCSDWFNSEIVNHGLISYLRLVLNPRLTWRLFWSGLFWGRISEEPWMGTHDNNLGGSLLQTDTPPYLISATDWTPQISFITSTMKFHSDVSTDNRSNPMYSCQAFLFYFLLHYLWMICVLCVSKQKRTVNNLFIR